MHFIIDAGHGPNTAGKRTPDGTLREYNFNNPVALEVGKQLIEKYGQKVTFSHDTRGESAGDVPLNTRTNLAISLKADAVISIHANAFGPGGWNSTSGIETFTYTEPTGNSTVLAANIQNHLLRNTGRKNRGVKKQNFQMVREPNKKGIDAVLVEAGFMTNQEEAALLKTHSYRVKVADAIVAGIAETYKLSPIVKTAAVVAKPKPAPVAAKGEEDMSTIYDPKSPTILEDTAVVLRRLEQKGDESISPQWREKLLEGKLTDSEAIGLLFTAIRRGVIVGEGEVK